VRHLGERDKRRAARSHRSIVARVGGKALLLLPLVHKSWDPSSEGLDLFVEHKKPVLNLHGRSEKRRLKWMSPAH
jgi:hypothetical protein